MGIPRQVFLSLLVATALVAMGWLVVRPDDMFVERLEFVGNVRATWSELRHLSEVRNGSRLWEVDLPTVTGGVSRHPWVAAVRTERRFPSTLVVHVEEHTPVAMLALGEEMFYVDASGRAFLRVQSDDLDHPVITGIEPQFAEHDERLPGLVLHDALWLLEQLDTRNLIPRSRVSELRFHRSRGFTLQTAGSTQGHPTAEILFGVGDYERQLQHLGALLVRNVDLTLPLHVDLAPERVAIVRPRDGFGPPGTAAPGALPGAEGSIGLTPLSVSGSTSIAVND